MTELAKGPAYRVVTSRLIARCWRVEDAPRLLEAVTASLDHLRPWMPWVREVPTLADEIAELRRFRAQFDLGQDFLYGLFEPDEREVVGGIGLHTRAGADTREIGYWIRSERAGRGYATEAAAALMRVAFEIDRADRVLLRCAPDNTGSVRIAEKLGFVHEGTLRRRLEGSDGAKRDAMIWTLFADEYAASPARELAREARAFDVVGRPLFEVREEEG